MKFVHTGDWHLGLRLGVNDLTETQFAQVERILALCQTHAVDALVVAGDVFEKRTGLAQLTSRLTELLKPHLARGLQVVLMAGNHDTPEHFEMMSALLALDDESQGRLRVIEAPQNFEMCGVQWGAMPYPDRDTLARYAREAKSSVGAPLAEAEAVSAEVAASDAGNESGGDVITVGVGDNTGAGSDGAGAGGGDAGSGAGGDAGGGAGGAVGAVMEEGERAINSGYAAKVAEIAAGFERARPAVFVGHVTVAGVKTPSEMELSYVQGLRLGREDLPGNADYIALGHIHQPQRIGGPNDVPCYYCGDLDRYNRGERGDPRKGVYLVEIGADKIANATWLDLPVTPFYDIEIAADAVEELPTRYPDLERAFVHVTLDCADCDDAAGARRRVYELCRRVLECELINESSEVAAPQNFAPSDWRQTALDYVAERFAERADLDDLSGKTRSILEEVENALK